MTLFGGRASFLPTKGTLIANWIIKACTCRTPFDVSANESFIVIAVTSTDRKTS